MQPTPGWMPNQGVNNLHSAGWPPQQTFCTYAWHSRDPASTPVTAVQHAHPMQHMLRYSS